MKKFVYFSTPRRAGRSLFERLSKEAHGNGVDLSKPLYLGVDWAKNSGMNRGDVIKRVANVIYVRFVTVVAY